MSAFEAKRKGVSEQVADHIKQRIVDKEYQAGDKIPGEREMASLLQVSRNTVREAYKILEAYGYITIKHGTGIFVASEENQIRKMTSFFFVTEDQVKDLFAIRKILERSAVEWAIDHASDEQLDQIDQVVKKAEHMVNAESEFEQLAALDHEFHLQLATFSKNTVLIRVMHNLIDLLRETRMKSNKITGRARKSVEEHRDIVQAMKQKNVQLAQERMQNHLESVEQSITSKLTEEER